MSPSVLSYIAISISTVAAIATVVTARRHFRDERRSTARENDEEFKGHVMQVILANEPALINKTKNELMTVLHDKLQVHFNDVVRRPEFEKFAERMGGLEKQMTVLLQMTGDIGGKVTVLLMRKES